MKKVQYAIVGIETTGGNASGSCITEIAIVIHDGKMVRDAPLFDGIAENVLELLTDRIFVAHNVYFAHLHLKKYNGNYGPKLVTRSFS